MMNYIEIKSKEDEIINKRNDILNEKSNLMEELIQYSLEYPKLFKVISNLKDRINNNSSYNYFENLPYRLIILKEDIYLSDADDSLKDNLIKYVEEVYEEVVELNSKEAKCNEILYKEIPREKAARKKELSVMKLQVSEITDDITEVNARIKPLKAIMENDNILPSVKEAASKSLNELEKRKTFLELKLNNIVPEDLKKQIHTEFEIMNSVEEYSRYVDMIEYEKNENEEIERQISSISQLINESLSKIKNDTDKDISERLGVNDIDNSNEGNKKRLSALEPEEPKLVKEKHKAKPKLIDKLKKIGKKSLGLLSMTAAVAVMLTTTGGVIGINKNKVIKYY